MSSLKEIHRGDPQNSRFVTAVFLFVFFVICFLFFRLMWVYVSAVVLALVLTTLFSGLHRMAVKRLGEKRRVLIALLCTAAVSTLVILPVALFGVALSAQVIDVYSELTAGRGVLEIFAQETTEKSRIARFIIKQGSRLGFELSTASVQSSLEEAVKASGTWLYDHLGGIAQNTFAILMNFSIMIIVLFALFAEGDRVRDYILDLSPLPDEQETMLLERFQAISRAVFVGNGIASGIQGFVCGLSFYIFGLGNGVLWGAVTAFFAFLPIVGASVVVLPAAAYLFLKGKVALAILFLIFNGIQIAFFEYGLKTRLIGGKAQANGVLVFIGIVAGLSVFGILGLFYGPLVLAMFLTIAEIYKEHYRADLMNIHSPWSHADAHATLSVTHEHSSETKPRERDLVEPEALGQNESDVSKADEPEEDAHEDLSKGEEAEDET